MKKTFSILVCFIFVAVHAAKAQFDTQLSNYWVIPNYFNPGYAGGSNNLEVAALYRMQWLGIEHAPRTTVVAGQMPLEFLGRKHGVGVSLYNDKAGLFSASVVSAQYAYRKQIGKGNLGVGIQLGYIDETFDGSKVKLTDTDNGGSSGSDTGDSSSTDESIPTSEVTGSSVDASFGVFYSTKKWYVGLSVTHLTAPQLELNEQYTLEIPRTYYFTAGYNIQLNNPLLELRPSLLVKTMEPSSFYAQGDSIVSAEEGNTMKAMWNQTQIDVSMRMVYNKTFWGGLSWRKDDAVVIMLGGKLKTIEFGYSYDFPTSDILKESSGSHELFLKYVIDMSKKKKTKNKHKSIRIL